MIELKTMERELLLLLGNATSARVSLLAETLKCTATVVRRGLKKLEQEGLVTVDEWKNVSVTPAGIDRLGEMCVCGVDFPVHLLDLLGPTLFEHRCMCGEVWFAENGRFVRK